MTLSEDSVEPQSGQFSLWGAIKKALGNAKNFFSNISNLDTRLNALEGQGGPVGSYDFGKSFPNILDATDTQLVAGVMVDNIWAGHTPIVWTTPIANSTFTDGDGVDRTVGEIFNGTWIINSYDGTRIVLTNTPNTTPPIFSYQNVGVYSVGFANATTAGVVRVGTGSDMTVDQITGDISIDGTKGYSIFHRLISLFTGTQKTQIRSDLNAASRDMDDLSAIGQNIANWSSNVSNCITYIPQDIKLELNNGTLTLKAGSKVYVPNGAGVFDEVTVASDIIISVASGATKYMLFYNRTIGSVWFAELVYQNSGTTPSGDGFYYNTSTNKTVFLRSGVADPYEFSLPIGIVTSDSTKYTSINQVFNGFGYIGSTVFALPGVKALIPNGRNDDGTLKNIDLTLTEVKTITTTSNIYYGYIGIASNGGWVEPSNVISYNSKENHVYYLGNYQEWVIVGMVSVSSGKITFLDTNTTFHAVDYNDTEFIGHQAMPTNEGYIDLTIGSSGSYYLAPADGYFNFRGYGYSVEIYRNDMHVCTMYTQEGWGAVIMPVSKGQRITILYNLTGDKNLRFYYANGGV